MNDIDEEHNNHYNFNKMMNIIYNQNKFSPDTNELILLYKKLNRNKSIKLDPN